MKMQQSNNDNNYYLIAYNNKHSQQKFTMELQQSEIINLAVNIFQNVGIKRYIGQIEALRHEDIYFEIYKIIFPDSMINIFKISESNLTTGEKIQKIIQEISSIIKLDLYHISGEAIAQGNRNHLTNWLQLLEALSNNCIAQQSYNPGGSQPDLDRQMQRQFEEDDYYTVQGVYGQFQKHVYTDQRPQSSQSQKDQSSVNDDKRRQKQKVHAHQYQHPHGHAIDQVNKKQKHKQGKHSAQDQQQDDLNRSFRKSQSSRNSNVLKPIQTKKKPNNKTKNAGKKKVTFKIDEGQNSNKNNPNQNFARTTIKKTFQLQKNTAASLQDPAPHLKLSRRQVAICRQYGYPIWAQPSEQQKLLRKKKAFISKMHKIQQQMQQKRINEESAKFQEWAYKANAQSARDKIKIQQQNNQRTAYINKKIVERQNFIHSLSGGQQALENIKQMFKKQKQYERRMRKIMLQEERKSAQQLMDLNFAAEIQNMVMATIGQ